MKLASVIIVENNNDARNDLRHAFAQRNAGRGLVWLRDRLGHASISVTERYLRNVLGVDTGRM